MPAGNGTCDVRAAANALHVLFITIMYVGLCVHRECGSVVLWFTCLPNKRKVPSLFLGGVPNPFGVMSGRTMRI